MAEVVSSKRTGVSLKSTDSETAKKNETIEVGEIYKILVENLKDAIVVLDLEGNLLFVNKAAEELTGYTKEEMVGHHAREIIPSKYSSFCTEIDRLALSGRPVPYFEVEIRRKDGRLVPVETGGQAVTKDERIVGIVIIVRDVSEREKGVRALAESRQRFERLFLSCPTAAVFADAEFRVLEVNTRFSELFGYSQDEVRGKLLPDLIVPERWQREEKDPSPEMGQECADRETVRRRKDGSLIPVSISAASVTGRDQRLGTLVLYGDIAERKKMEKALIESEERYRCLVDNATVAIAVTDLEGRLTFANTALADLLGYSMKEMLGCHWKDFLPPEDREKTLSRFRDVLDAQKSESVEFRAMRKDGTVLHLMSSPTRFRTNGKTVGFEVIVEDITSRKKAEHAIREDQQKFERLFVKIPEAAIYWDSNYRVLDINPRFTELFGYTLDEIQGKDSTSFLVPESSLDESDSLGRKARLGSVHKDAVRKRKDGSLVPVSISVAPLIFDGQLTGLVGLYKDMTERKRIEDALRDSEEKYRSLVENSKDSIVIIDLNGNVLFHNKATEELTGYTTGHKAPSNVREITPLRYWPKSLAMLLKARQGKPTPYFESAIRRKDGKLVAVESGGQAIFKNGRITGIQIITRDISERKRSNKALRHSKERFRNLFENALDVILATDLQGNVTSINKAIERFGWKADDIVGRSMFEFMSEETWPSLLRGLDQITEGKPLEGEMELLTPTGRRTAEFRSNAMVQDGKTVGIQVIGRDVTERKKMEEKLQRYSHHLEEMVDERTQQLRNAEEQLVKTTRLATIGELAAMVAHDLRNPLASIRNASYFVKSECRYRKDPKCKTNREMLNIIEQETVFANSIINSLLDFAARKPLRCRRQSISNLVESAVRKSDIAKSIRVERNLPEKMAINGDGKQLKRAFLNLIENAAQAMPNGGRLAITATETEENVAIDFADTGTGIPDENMDRIFTPLFTTKAKGIGMGLPICKRVTEEHGGTISVKSKVGQGTTFTITLPRNRGGRDE